MTRLADVPLEVPAPVKQVLGEFVDAAEHAFGEALRSIVLYGSAAEGRLRATSDVNVLVVLSAFDPDRADAFSAPLQAAQAAIDLQPMFVLDGELPDAATAFAQKFDDMTHRHQVLFGEDPFVGLHIPREALRARLLQTTLNMALRLRAQYVATGRREEQRARLAADAAGPLRAAAAALLELEGQPAGSPKEALERVAGQEGEPAATLARLSQIRDGHVSAPGVASAVLLQLMTLARRMNDRARNLS